MSTLSRRSATVCYVESISHRELRNNSAQVLRRVEAGESFLITNHGRVTAKIVPPGMDVIEELIEAGQMRPAVKPLDELADIEPQTVDATSKEIIDDVRRAW